MLMVKSSREGILKFNPYQRPFILSRSGFLGSQRYAATWTGDNVASIEHLKLSVPMSLSLGLSGQPFSGSDIGGYSGKTSPELYAQWIALGAFYPFSRGHSEKGKINKEPWAFGQNVEDVARVALNRRYRLLPYLYNLFYEASVTGLPVMRPVFFADTKDLSLRKEEQAFMLGNDLLIVPKWATSPALPKGKWTTVSLAGEKSSKDPYQPDVKIRAGAIVPLGMYIQNTTEYTTSELTLLVSLDKNGQAKGTLYEDEGNGFGYQKGDFLLSTIVAKKVGGQVKVSILPSKGKRKPIKRKITIVVVGEEKK
jgi:alpha-glucosidase